MSRCYARNDGYRIECPHCRVFKFDLRDHIWTGTDDAPKTVVCGACGMEFLLTLRASVSYTSETP
jgi:hypothetical protein